MPLEVIDSMIDRMTLTGPSTIAVPSQDNKRKAVSQCVALASFAPPVRHFTDVCSDAVLVPATDAYEAALHDLEAIGNHVASFQLHYRPRKDSPVSNDDVRSDPRCPTVPDADTQCDEYPFRASR